jgi:hypothetical protein
MKHIAAVLALMFAMLSSVPSWPDNWARPAGRALVKHLLPFEPGKCQSQGMFGKF